MDVKKGKGENYLIKKDKVVKVIKYDASGDIEIQDTLNKSNTFNNVKKISKHEYVVLDTGEIRYYKSGTNKSQNDLRRSMKKLNQILRNNFTGAENELYITLTTERDVTHIREIKEKFQHWWGIMKGEFKDLEFVAVYEKHTYRDGWHIHTMIKAPTCTNKNYYFCVGGFATIVQIPNKDEQSYKNDCLFFYFSGKGRD